VGWPSGEKASRGVAGSWAVREEGGAALAGEKVEGIYYEEAVGGGGLQERVRYWARDSGEGQVVVEYLKADGTTTGMAAERVSREEFGRRFVKEEAPKKKAEPPKSPKEQLRDRCVQEGKVHLERKEFHLAESEFKNALKLDEGHVEANYGLGETYVGQGKTEEARRIFARLSDNDRLYTKENKYIFNKLGILLRRQGLYPLALKNYERAIRIDHTDPVLFYNLARVLYHLEQKEKAIRFLKNALALNPGFQEASEFLAFMEKGK